MAQLAEFTIFLENSDINFGQIHVIQVVVPLFKIPVSPQQGGGGGGAKTG